LIDVVQRYLPFHSRAMLERRTWFTPVRLTGLQAVRGTSFGSFVEMDCPPGISVNGDTPWPGTSLSDYQLSEVEAIEVYRRGNWVPIEFARVGRCGLVILWLK
jgi:hypothetical protein